MKVYRIVKISEFDKYEFCSRIFKREASGASHFYFKRQQVTNAKTFPRFGPRFGKGQMRGRNWDPKTSDLLQGCGKEFISNNNKAVSKNILQKLIQGNIKYASTEQLRSI